MARKEDIVIMVARGDYVLTWESMYVPRERMSQESIIIMILGRKLLFEK